MKKVFKDKVNDIIDVVLDHAEFDIETTGYHDYDITPYVNDKDKDKVAELLWEILTDKKPRKYWKLINVAIRRIK